MFAAKKNRLMLYICCKEKTGESCRFEDRKMQVKICGITSEEEIEKLNELKADYAGFVLFFQKSKRNLELPTAAKLRAKLKYSKAVAVTVSPSPEQAKQIEEAGFDIIQVHGELFEEVRDNCKLPIWRAVNISAQSADDIKAVLTDEGISGVVFDGAVPGSGESFDWHVFDSMIQQFRPLPEEDNKLKKCFVLAGGLTPDNVVDAIQILNPDVVDVSSGVEYGDKEKKGKDPDKVEKFMKNARSIG